jgi:hypothetical protein
VLDFIAGILDIVGWIVDIATLDMRRMSPVAIFFSILVFGSIGLVLTIVPLARLIGGPSWAEALGMLFALALGLAMLARIAYGLYDRWRGQEMDTSNTVEH